MLSQGISYMPAKQDDTTDEQGKKIYYDPISVAKRTKQVAYFVQEHDKAAILEQIIKSSDTKQSVVIVKSKKIADELGIYLNNLNIKAIAIHGNHRHEQHEEAVKVFNSKEINYFITTDKILESLELTSIEQIISYHLPLEPKQYLTRIGFLKEIGNAITLISPEEQTLLDGVEFAMKMDIPEEELEGFIPSPAPIENKTTNVKKKKPRHTKKKQKKENRSE